MNLTPCPPLHGCQHLKFSVSERGAIPSVPSAYPGVPELLSPLLAKQQGRVLQWGILKEKERVTGLKARPFQS